MSPAFSSLVRPERVSRWHIRQEGGNACELLTDMLIAIGGVLRRSLSRQALRWCAGTACPARNFVAASSVMRVNTPVAGTMRMTSSTARRWRFVMAGEVLLLAPFCPPRRLEKLHDTTAIFWLNMIASFQSSLMEVEVWRCSCWASLRESPECSAASSQLPTR